MENHGAAQMERSEKQIELIKLYAPCTCRQGIDVNVSLNHFVQTYSGPYSIGTTACCRRSTTQNGIAITVNSFYSCVGVRRDHVRDLCRYLVRGSFMDVHPNSICSLPLRCLSLSHCRCSVSIGDPLFLLSSGSLLVIPTGFSTEICSYIALAMSWD